MRIRICPKCGSLNIVGDPTTDSMGVGYKSFMCDDCKYSGMFFPEIDEADVSKFKRDVKK